MIPSQKLCVTVTAISAAKPPTFVSVAPPYITTCAYLRLAETSFENS